MPRNAQMPPPGVYRNGTAEASPGRWYDANNIRWRGGVMIPVGGNALLLNTLVPDPIRDVFTWHDNSFRRWCAIGTDKKLYAYLFDNQQIWDITPTGAPPILPPGFASGYGLGNFGNAIYGISSNTGAPIQPPGILGAASDWWSMDSFGELLVVVPTQDGHLYSWDPNTPTTPATQVLNAPTNNRGVIVTDQRAVVLYGAGGDPRRVQWSDQEDMTVWTAGVANMAGDKQLQSQAVALTACKTASGILLFTTNDVHLMSYAGPPFAYGITQIGNGCGPISPRAVASAGSFVAWMSWQNFWQWNGNVQPLICDVKNWFFANLNKGSAGRLFASLNPQFAEVWWDWPDQSSGSGENNRYLAYNYGRQPGHWLIGQRARTAGDLGGTLDYPVLGGIAPSHSGGALYQHESGYTDNGAPRASAGQVWIESGSITDGEGDQRYHVRQVVLDAMADPTLAPPIGFQFFAREQPFDPIETASPLYTAIHNGLMDTRISGRSIRMRLEALSDQPFGVGRTRLDLAPGGTR